jgi:pyruvate formate lyase activating enzyme
MDVKAPPEKYPLLCGIPEVDTSHVARSITLLQESNIDYEFRTTVVPGLLDEDDIEAIAHWIKGAKRYILQQFRPLNTLDPTLETAIPYPPADLHAMAERASRWVPHTSVREA